MLPIVLAVLASTTLGVGVALQHEAASEETGVALMDPRLLTRLVRRKKWVAGIVVGMVGAAMQGTAIATGLLIVVAPIFALHVAVALGFASFRSKRALERRHWGALAMAVTGLATFLVAASPEETDSAASVPWAVPIGVVAIGVIAVRIVVGRLPAGRAALAMAAVAGLGFGVSDSMVKSFTDVADADGWSSVPSHWSLAAWGIFSTLSFWLSQSAHNMADITASLPATATLQPAVGALLGSLMFGETIRGGAAIPVEVLAIAVLVTGVVLLASTPLPEPRLATALAEN